tara:strand:+ start:2553 stop:3719 length:1167 start_codon:yes stop_codon:yes gene_type:complete
VHANVLDLTLSSYVFQPGNVVLTRDRLGTWESRSPGYDERFDYYTLIYDVFYDETAQKVIAICPALMNFERLINEAEFAIDNDSVPVASIEKTSKGTARGSLIMFDWPQDKGIPQFLEIKHPLFSGVMAINRTHRDHFKGCNALYAISKNNRLDWIADWLAYHVAEHGANAVVIYDNNSTDYTMDALADTIAGVDGIERAAIVRANFPFGPSGEQQTNYNSKFLHMTMVEYGRRTLLTEARAVLNVDIDELVYSKTGESIFDATVKSEKGYVRMKGQWVYTPRPEQGQGHAVRHADHCFIRTDLRRGVHRKYCVAPKGPLEGWPWLTHRIVSRKDVPNSDFGLWHFRGVSNSWDYDRADFDDAVLEKDDRLIKTMARNFGPGATATVA